MPNTDRTVLGAGTGGLAPSGLGPGTSAARRGSSSLLSPVDYDADAVSIRSDQDSDSDDDQLQQRARNSRELRAADRMVFMEEDETDRLVTDARRQAEAARGRRRSSNLSALNVVHPLGPLNPLKLLTGLRGRGSRSASPSSTTLRPSTSSGSLDEKDDDNDNDEKSKRRARRTRRQAKKERLLAQARDGEDGELMFEMEEGGIKTGSSTGESSDRESGIDSDHSDSGHAGLLGLGSGGSGQSARDKMAQTTQSRKRRGWGRLVLALLVVVGLVLVALGVYKAVHDRRTRAQATQTTRTLVSNGTALFAPTTLIISLDGFRADFVNRGLTPRLNAFIREGVSPLYMRPSFPSVTFPNHYTLATGLYPESHGVVGNSFWDPAAEAEFFYTDPSRSLDPMWWGGEPFWATAERAGARAAIHMWPGSEALVKTHRPSYVDKFNGTEALARKTRRILEFLDQPGLETAAADDVDGSRVVNLRPQLIAAYVPNVDADGHRYGPNSTEIRSTIAAVDSMLNDIFAGLEARNLTHIVNVIVVSDHGMATTDATRLMQLDDLVDLDRIAHLDGWPLVGLRPHNASDLPSLYQDTLQRTKGNPNVDVYLRDHNMPARYHFAHNDRIAPLWLVPKTGWNIVERKHFDIAHALATGQVYHPRGLHGYDHEHPLMRALFVARGPAFPHAPNSKLAPFQNIEVYNLVCDSIGIAPAPNNGTLRLPLAPVGLHDATPDEPFDPVPPYPPSSTSTVTFGVSSLSSVPTLAPTSALASTTVASTPAAPPASASASAPASAPASASASAPANASDKSFYDEVVENASSFWDWLTDKFNEVLDKINSEQGTAEADA